MEGGDFTGHAAFRETLHGPTKLEIDPRTADMIEDWVQRFEAAAERMENAASEQERAAEKMQSAARRVDEGAGTMYAAARR